MARALAVTGLAAHADLGKGGVKAVSGRIVVFMHAGRMTLGAHEIPVLIEFGPMQDIVVLDLLVRVEMEPALAALLLWSTVPCDRQCLDASIGEFDQILLQRIDTERVLHLEDGKFAVRPVGFDEEFAVLAEKPRFQTVIVEGCIGEIAQYRFVGRVIHRMLVLRCMPSLGFGPMAARAGVAADERCDRCVSRIPVDRAAVEEVETETDRGDDYRSERCRDPNLALRQQTAFGRAWRYVRRQFARRRACGLPRRSAFGGRLASFACQRYSPCALGSRTSDRSAIMYLKQREAASTLIRPEPHRRVSAHPFVCVFCWT